MNYSRDIRFTKTADLMSELPTRYQDKYEKGIGIARPKIVRIAPFRNLQRTNSLEGVSYLNLVDAFGEPYSNGRQGDKVDAQWYLQVLPSTDLISIWNYKNGPNYTGSEDIRDINEWSVYTSTPSAYEALVEYLKHPKDDPSNRDF